MQQQQQQHQRTAARFWLAFRNVMGADAMASDESVFREVGTVRCPLCLGTYCNIPTSPYGFVMRFAQHLAQQQTQENNLEEAAQAAEQGLNQEVMMSEDLPLMETTAAPRQLAAASLLSLCVDFVCSRSRQIPNIAQAARFPPDVKSLISCRNWRYSLFQAMHPLTDPEHTLWSMCVRENALLRHFFRSYVDREFLHSHIKPYTSFLITEQLPSSMSVGVYEFPRHKALCTLHSSFASDEPLRLRIFNDAPMAEESADTLRFPSEFLLLDVPTVCNTGNPQHRRRHDMNQADVQFCGNSRMFTVFYRGAVWTVPTAMLGAEDPISVPKCRELLLRQLESEQFLVTKYCPEEGVCVVVPPEERVISMIHPLDARFFFQFLICSVVDDNSRMFQVSNLSRRIEAIRVHYYDPMAPAWPLSSRLYMLQEHDIRLPSNRPLCRMVIRKWLLYWSQQLLALENPLARFELVCRVASGVSVGSWNVPLVTNFVDSFSSHEALLHNTMTRFECEYRSGEFHARYGNPGSWIQGRFRRVYCAATTSVEQDTMHQFLQELSGAGEGQPYLLRSNTLANRLYYRPITIGTMGRFLLAEETIIDYTKEQKEERVKSAPKAFTFTNTGSIYFAVSLRNMYSICVIMSFESSA
jgi:hypothetical protein